MDDSEVRVGDIRVTHADGKKLLFRVLSVGEDSAQCKLGSINKTNRTRAKLPTKTVPLELLARCELVRRDSHLPTPKDRDA